MLLVWFAAALLAAPAAAQPRADHHQHLFSPAIASLVSTPAAPVAPITAADLIRVLDEAGIERAAVMSTAYIFGQPTRTVENRVDRMRADNDWTSRQIAPYRDRLVGFCGVNPLEDGAIEELRRCAQDPNLRTGVKLHLGNSGVDYRNPAHIDRLRKVFAAADDHGMAIVVHARASFNQKLPYGADEARTLLDEVLAAAPDVPVQIAHLAGGGGPDDPVADAALRIFADAVSNDDPRAKHLWFDVSGLATASPARQAVLVERIRQIGLHRILYGSDAPTSGNSPSEAWAAFRTLPLTDEEFRTIEQNLAPYMR
jgi:uncharacterized protein